MQHWHATCYMWNVTYVWMHSLQNAWHFQGHKNLKQNKSYFSAKTLLSLMHCHYHLAQTWSLAHPCPTSFPWRHVAWFHCYKQEVPLVYISKCQWILHSVACHTLLSIRGHYGPNMTLFCPFFSTPSWWDRVLGHRRASVTLWISSASEHFGVKHQNETIFRSIRSA